jgi:hypothetical protein
MKGKIKGGEFVAPESIGARDIRDMLDNPFDIPLISNFLNGSASKDALLIHYSIEEFGFGEYALLEFKESGKFRSNSEAVIEQIKGLLKSCNNSPVPVMVHVAKKRNKSGQEYYSLLG